MIEILFIAIFILSALVLAKAGAMAVNSLLKISRFLKWKTFIVGSIVMGLLSSMPDLFVGLNAAFTLRPELSYGNVIGSNIILLTLILGGAVLLGGVINLKGRTIKRSLFFSAFYALLPLLLIADGWFSRGDGIILIIALVFYLKEFVSQERRFSKVLNGKELSATKYDKMFFREMGIFIGSFLILVLSAQGVVFAAGRLALAFNAPLVLIGALGVALGTSLPEIAFGFRSIALKQKEMLLGTVFGSIAINSTLVLGFTCLIAPFKIYNPGLYVNGFVFTGIAVLLFLIFFLSGDRLNKREAKILLFLYFLFFIVQLFIN